MPQIATTTAGATVFSDLTGSGNIQTSGTVTVPVRFLGSTNLSVGSSAIFTDTQINKEFFVADNNYQIIGIAGKYTVNGSTTLNVGKLFNASVSLVGSALNVMSSALNYFGSAGLYMSATLFTSTALTVLAPGDSLALIWGTAGNMPPIGVLEVSLARL